MALSAADSLVLHRDTRASCMDHGFVEVSADNNGGLWCDLAYNEARRALAQYDEAMLMMTLKKTPFIPTIAQASSPPERALRPSTDSVSPGATNAPHGRDNLDLRRHANATRANEFARHIHTIPHQTQSIIPLSSDATSTGKSRGLTWQTIIQYMRHLEQPSPFDANSFSSNLPDYAHTKHEKCTKKYVESQVNWEEAPPIFDANIFAFLVVMVLISATKSTHRLLMALFWLNFTACKAYESAPKKLGPYYVYESAPKKWNDAESYCQTTYGTHLATIWDDQAADELVTLFQTGGRLWIGLNDKDVEGTWVYVDGSADSLCGGDCGSNQNYKYWDYGQPNNHNNQDLDCGIVRPDNPGISSMLHDDSCTKSLPFACNNPKIVLRINEVITITGDGFDAETERFSVKFQVNSDIAFNYGTLCDEQVVVRNTKENGQWQTEERSGGMLTSCNPQDPLSLSFKLTDTKWEVSSFGNRLTDYDYNHRMSFDAINIIAHVGIINPAIKLDFIFTEKDGLKDQIVKCWHECAITCSGESTCESATIICHEDQPCNVICSGWKACADASFTWPTEPGLGSISCNGDLAC
eukprot:452161_1